MNIHEEIYLLSKLIIEAGQNREINLQNPKVWSSLFLHEDTSIPPQYFYNLNEQGIIDYEEVGDEGFEPIIMCTTKPETTLFLKQKINEADRAEKNARIEQYRLNSRIHEILNFNPLDLTKDIRSSQIHLDEIREHISKEQILAPLSSQIDLISRHLNSLDTVASKYEEVYKNLILPIQKEGKSGIQQTVKWAIISIVASTIISLIVSYVFSA